MGKLGFEVTRQPVNLGVYHMSEPPPISSRTSQDYVQFFAAGESVKGEFHCAECGYGIAVYRTLPLCPMCGGSSWEQSAWSPLTRAADHLR
jgi:hypothetical protein